MNARIGREKYLTIALTAAAFLLAGVLLLEWNQAMRLQQELLKMRNIPAVAAKPLNILPEFSLPAIDAGFPELISRSLFSVNRRSSAVPGKGGVVSMKKGQFSLVGILITPQLSSAQLRDVQTNKAETVALNGVVRGMTVAEIGPSSAVLKQGAESEELILNVQIGIKGASARPMTPAVLPAKAPATPSSAPASAPARAASNAVLPVPAVGEPAPAALQLPKDSKKQ